jgi:activating signal cointegrator complex subunit 3
MQVCCNFNCLLSNRDQLGQLFGPVFTNGTLLKAAELAHKLYVWRLQSNPSSAEARSLPASTRAAKLDIVEFGSDLEFRVPPFAVGVELGDDHGSEFTSDNYTKNQKDAHENQNSVRLSQVKAKGLPHGGLLQEVYTAPEEVQKVEDEGGGVNLRWFKRMCDKAAEAGTASQFSGDELAVAVAHVMESERSGDEIAGDLFDLIGDAWFDFIQELLQHRKELVDMIHKGLAALKVEKAPPAQSRMPSYGTQVSVQTASQKQSDKLLRKEQRNARKGFGAAGDGDSDLDWLAGAGGFSALINSSDNGNVGLDALYGKGDDAYGLSGAALPAGSSRKTYKGY